MQLCCCAVSLLLRALLMWRISILRVRALKAHWTELWWEGTQCPWDDCGVSSSFSETDSVLSPPSSLPHSSLSSPPPPPGQHVRGGGTQFVSQSEAKVMSVSCVRLPVENLLDKKRFFVAFVEKPLFQHPKWPVVCCQAFEKYGSFVTEASVEEGGGWMQTGMY